MATYTKFNQRNLTVEQEFAVLRARTKEGIEQDWSHFETLDGRRFNKVKLFWKTKYVTPKPKDNTAYLTNKDSEPIETFLFDFDYSTHDGLRYVTRVYKAQLYAYESHGDTSFIVIKFLEAQPWDPPVKVAAQRYLNHTEGLGSWYKPNVLVRLYAKNKLDFDKLFPEIRALCNSQNYITWNLHVLNEYHKIIPPLRRPSGSERVAFRIVEEPASGGVQAIIPNIISTTANQHIRSPSIAGSVSTEPYSPPGYSAPTESPRTPRPTDYTIKEPKIKENTPDYRNYGLTHPYSLEEHPLVFSPPNEERIQNKWLAEAKSLGAIFSGNNSINVPNYHSERSIHNHDQLQSDTIEKRKQSLEAYQWGLPELKRIKYTPEPGHDPKGRAVNRYSSFEEDDLVTHGEGGIDLTDLAEIDAISPMTTKPALRGPIKFNMPRSKDPETGRQQISKQFHLENSKRKAQELIKKLNEIPRKVSHTYLPPIQTTDLDVLQSPIPLAQPPLRTVTPQPGWMFPSGSRDFNMEYGRMVSKYEGIVFQFLEEQNRRSGIEHVQPGLNWKGEDHRSDGGSASMETDSGVSESYYRF